MTSPLIYWELTQGKGNSRVLEDEMKLAIFHILAFSRSQSTRVLCARNHHNGRCFSWHLMKYQGSKRCEYCGWFLNLFISFNRTIVEIRKQETQRLEIFLPSSIDVPTPTGHQTGPLVPLRLWACHICHDSNALKRHVVALQVNGVSLLSLDSFSCNSARLHHQQHDGW